MAAASGVYTPPDPRDLFSQAGQAVRRLVEMKNSLLEPLEDRDNFPVEDFAFYLQIWDDLLSSSTAADSLAHMPSEGYVSYWINPQMLYNVMSAVSSISTELQTLTDPSAAAVWAKTLIKELEGCLRRAKVSRFSEAPENLRERIRDLVNGLDNTVEEYKRSHLENLAVTAREAAQSAVSSATSASSAAGLTGEAATSRYYDRLATDELSQANRFRMLTVATVVTGILGTAAFVLGPELNWAWTRIEPTDYVHVFQRALLIGAVAGLAGYFSRQSHHHRATANWASSLAVQLKTFSAFLAPLNNQQLADELRKDFGARVFGEHPAMKRSPKINASAESLDTTLDLITKLTANGR